MALPTVNALSDRCRRVFGDYPAVDTISAQVANTGTTVNLLVNNVGAYKVGLRVVLDQESFLPFAIAGSTTGTLTCFRAWDGTTAATHAANSPVLVGPRFTPQVMLDAISDGLRALWPYFFQYVEDETLTTTADTQSDYAMPAAFGNSGVITAMQILLPGLTNDGWRDYRWFHHLEGAGGRTVSLIRIPPVSTKLRLRGLAPFDSGDVVAGGTLPTTLPDAAVAALVMYSQHYLASVGEAMRDNDATARNIGPMSVQAGLNQTVSQFHYQRFVAYCQQHQMRYPQWRTRRKI